jgi:cysteine desulfurase/selenocysteine lyase
MEHHSNIVPWQLACQDTGAKLRYLDISDEGTLSLDELDGVLAEGRVKLVGVVHVSNVLGTINPIAEVVARAHAAGAVVVVDGTQAVPQMPVDVGEIGADFYAWTGHKALGPTGVGVLHGRRELLSPMQPSSVGHMIPAWTTDAPGSINSTSTRTDRQQLPRRSDSAQPLLT